MAVGVICLCLSLVTIVFSRQNRKLQEVVQAQQALMNKGALSQQIGTNLVREMATAAQTDDKMRQLLKDNGFTFNAQPEVSPNR